MYKFNSNNDHTLWRSGASEALCLQINNIANKVIKSIDTWWQDQVSMETMPEQQRQTLFDANLVNFYIKQHKSKDCGTIASGVYNVISSCGRNAQFYNDILDIIKPHLDPVSFDISIKQLGMPL